MNGFTTASDMESTLIQRLLKYAQGPKHMIESQEARAVFNDLQLILRNDYTARKGWNKNYWNPIVKEHIIQIRNLMNVTQALLVNGESKETRKLVHVNEIRDRDTDLSKITNIHAAWITPYGRVQVSFWAVSNDSNLKTRGDATKTDNKTVAARLAIVPSDIGTSPFRVVFDFTPHLDPSATITYQAMIPNDSEVFKIAGSGGVKELIELLEKGIASLTDCDEEGCSLLNYAITYTNIDMCNFLVHKKADINAIELCRSGCIGPVHSVHRALDAEMEEIGIHERARCFRIMLEAGADLSLEISDEDGVWRNAFVEAIIDSSLAILKHIVDFGEPFISLNGIYNCFWGKCSALTILAHGCGYIFGEAIDVVDKAILLLNRKADISCRDENGDTVLHTLLKCQRRYESQSKTEARRCGRLQIWDLSFKAPKDLLMVFITAGADVYATNDDGETPFMVASKYGREDEWIEALELCGYESEEVLTSCIHHPTREHQTSKLSFQKYCQQRQQRQNSGRFEQVQSDDIDNDSQYYDEDAYEDDHEEIRVITDNTECVDGGGGNMEIFGGVECADYSMDIRLDDEGEKHIYKAEEMVDHQGLGLDDIVDNDIEGMDVNLDDWLDNGIDFMQSFIDFGMFLDTPFE
ncbi:ankyrin repeat-containing domain protein [Halenospora varia]|nr:ankyrin repeat-containing domain protein [Halenospora varia]